MFVLKMVVIKQTQVVAVRKNESVSIIIYELPEIF